MIADDLVQLRVPLYGFPAGHEGKVTSRHAVQLDARTTVRCFRVRVQDSHRSTSGYFAEAEFHRCFRPRPR